MTRRFFTPNGRFVGLHRLPNAARSLGQALRRKVTGTIPRLPWIPFAAADQLATELKRDWRVWEVGAGFSTLWLAERAGHVTSIEASKEWYDRLGEIIAKEHIENVTLRYEWQAERMSDFSTLPEASLDLLFIDGGPRSQCLINGFNKVRSGGLVYMDNWECPGFWEGAVDFLDRAGELIASRSHFIDYVPAQFGVYEGLLLRKR